jgi:3'-phosphoadenosine 5'-phosphosulfate sulfotransferase (PAPS reductase)/FAD synthetase
MKNTIQAIKNISALTEKVILFHSISGKDSICVLDLISSYFKEIICVYMYVVPGLDYINRYKSYIYKKYSNVKQIIDTPHYCTVSWMKTGFMGLRKKDVKKFELHSIVDFVRTSNPGFEWVCFGMKQSDSIQRKWMLRRKEFEFAITNYKTQKFYPLSSWSDKDVMAYIELKNLLRPIKYNNDRSQGDEIYNIDYLLWIRQNSPSDLEKIFSLYPICKVKLFEYDHHEKERAEI